MRKRRQPFGSKKIRPVVPPFVPVVHARSGKMAFATNGVRRRRYSILSPSLLGFRATTGGIRAELLSAESLTTSVVH